MCQEDHVNALIHQIAIIHDPGFQTSSRHSEIAFRDGAGFVFAVFFQCCQQREILEL